MGGLRVSPGAVNPVELRGERGSPCEATPQTRPVHLMRPGANPFAAPLQARDAEEVAAQLRGSRRRFREARGMPRRAFMWSGLTMGSALVMLLLSVLEQL